MTSAEIIQGILSGEFDQALSGINDAVQARRHALGSARYGLAEDTTPNGLRAGDRCKFGNIRPKYMVGIECTIVKVNPVKVKVTIDKDNGRFKAGEALTVPPSALVKV